MAPGRGQLAVGYRGLMKVGIVCPYDLGIPGGVQQITIELTQRLDDALLIGPGQVSASVPVQFRSVGRARAVRANRSRAPIAIGPAAWTRTIRAIGEVDLIHVHEPFVPVVGWAALSLPYPIVATFHADPPRWMRRLYTATAVAGEMWLGDAHPTAVSPVAAGGIPHRWRRPVIVPNAIDVSSYQVDVVRVQQRVIFLGRDDPRKGLDVLLRAWPAVVARHPAAELFVLGVDRPAVLHGVTFLGRVTEQEKQEMLGSGVIFVAPNKGGESFGLIVAEAMAAGCAVVASDIPAFKYVVGENGVLFPSGDAQALSAELNILLDDGARIESLAGLGRAAVQRFDWTRVISQYMDVYESAIRGHASTIKGQKE